MSRATMLVGDAIAYWVGEVLVVRRRSVLIKIDPINGTLEFSAFPGTSDQEIAAALEVLKKRELAPDRWPTQRLPHLR